MAYTLQLRDVRNSSVRDISSVCATSVQFRDRVNEITRRLMTRGGWWTTEVLLKICIYGCYIVWPRQVGTVLGLRFCLSDAVTLRNNWWSVYGYRSHGWCGNVVFRDDGTRPCYNEVTGTTGKYIRYNIVKSQDVGKTIRIFGFKYGNQPLQELDASGNWVDGITLTATTAGVQSTVLVTKITDVVREATQGRCFLYEVDPSSGDPHDLAVYEPDETNPSYRCSIVQGWQSIPFSTDAYGRHVRQATALVKLAFVPAMTDDDFVMLDNLSALKLGFQAIQLEEANQDEQAQAKLLLAIRELNFELRDKEPNLQTTIVVNNISSACPILAPI